MMANVDSLLNEFAEAWNTGRRPRVDDYLERAFADDRNELAELIGAFLELAPTPRYSAKQLEELRKDPTVKKIGGLLDSKSGLWPSLLPRLRGRAKLTREQVVGRLAELIGAKAQEQKVKEYYHRMETGRLDPQGVSSKVLKTLAEIFRVDVREIEEAGDFSMLPPQKPAAAYLRSETALELSDEETWNIARGAESPGDWDEVDELFRGGR
jgi:hypothetical protein